MLPIIIIIIDVIDLDCNGSIKVRRLELLVLYLMVDFINSG